VNIKERFIVYSDRLILVCLCLLIFFLPFAKAAAETFTWMAVFFWILKRVLGFRAQSFWHLLPRTDLNKALAILVAVNLASLIFSVYPYLSLRGFFGKELKFLAIFFMAVESINTVKKLKGVVFTIIASALLITADAAVQIYTGKDFLRGYPLDTFSASFFAATGFASWLTVMIPALIGIAAANLIDNWRLKILLYVTAFVQFLYLIKTLSRGAWIGFVTGIISMVYYIIKRIDIKKRMLCLYAAIILFLIFLFLPQPVMFKIKDTIRVKLNLSQTISQRIKAIAQVDQGSVSERMQWWKEASNIIRDYPFFGCGINTYSKVSPKYKISQYGGGYPHNSYLQKAAETGVLGLIAFLAVIFIFFKSAWQYLGQKKDFLVLGFFSGIFAFLIHAFFDTHFYSLQLVVLFWFMLGLTVAAIKLGQGEQYEI